MPAVCDIPCSFRSIGDTKSFDKLSECLVIMPITTLILIDYHELQNPIVDPNWSLSLGQSTRLYVDIVYGPLVVCSLYISELFTDHIQISL